VLIYFPFNYYTREVNIFSKDDFV